MMKMMIDLAAVRRFCAVVVLLLAMSVPSVAQNAGRHADRDRWFKEMRQYKRDYMEKALKLDEAQKERFAVIFENAESETDKINRQTRRMEREIDRKGEAATDLEREKLAEALFELRSKEGAIELDTYRQLKEVLSPAQLVEYKKAERRFVKELMRHQPRKGKKK